MTTAADLLREMTSFVNVDAESIRSAERSGLNTDNSAALRQVVEDWSNGRYDEDPNYVVTEIEDILFEFEEENI